MELNLQDIKDIANRRANRKSNKMTIFQAVMLTIIFVSLISLLGLVIDTTLKIDKAKTEKVTYSIPTAGDLIYEDGVYTINGYLIKSDKEVKIQSTHYLSIAILVLFMFSFGCYVFDVLGRMEKEKNRIMDYYFEHKELPKEE